MNELSRATVVGGRGFIGSHLVNALEKAGVECWIPAHDDRQIFQRPLGAVFYCAGVNSASLRPGYDSQELHVGYLARLLDRASFDSLTYLSSTRVYMNAERGAEDAPLEVSPVSRDELFNITKLAGEAICLADNRQAVRVARVSNVFGRGARPGTFVPSIIIPALRGRRVVLRSAPETAKDYISIGDCVRALLAVERRGDERIYNVASGTNVTHAQILEILRKRTRANFEVASGAQTVRFPQIDVTRLRRLIPEPFESILASLDDLVCAYEESA